MQIKFVDTVQPFQYEYFRGPAVKIAGIENKALLE